MRLQVGDSYHGLCIAFDLPVCAISPLLRTSYLQDKNGVSSYFGLKRGKSAKILTVVESKNCQCHPCESRGLWPEKWIPASAGMTNVVSTTVTKIGKKRYIL